MFTRIVLKRGQRDEAEKPFWISFSDLMTACMTLFLVVMAITILSIKTQSDHFTEVTRDENQRHDQIKTLTESLKKKLQADWPDIEIKGDSNAVYMDLGKRLYFGHDRADISPDGAALLRAFVPDVLSSIDAADKNRWVKSLVVEGFTDQDGTYLHNVQLSLNRSQNVICTLFSQPKDGTPGLSNAELNTLRRLAFIGGYSSNSAKANKEESRRVELSLEFRRLGELPADPAGGQDYTAEEFGQCH